MHTRTLLLDFSPAHADQLIQKRAHACAREALRFGTRNLRQDMLAALLACGQTIGLMNGLHLFAACSHRCFLCMGDLERYRQTYSSADEARDWSVAASYYVCARTLAPRNAKPYNQLAVLATYQVCVRVRVRLCVSRRFAGSSIGTWFLLFIRKLGLLCRGSALRSP